VNFFSSKLLNPLIFTVHSNNEKRTPREIYKKRRWKEKRDGKTRTLWKERKKAVMEIAMGSLRNLFPA
jgi:hypothetical protein